jgi:hypothetical protein
MAKLSKIPDSKNRLEFKTKMRNRIKLDTILQLIQILALAYLVYKASCK